MGNQRPKRNLRWMGYGLGLTFFLGICGCQKPSPPPLTLPTTTKEPVLVEQGDEPNTIQLLVEELFQGQEDEEFGYFVYLIFAEQSQVTYRKRLAAAKAFLCQHSTVSDAGELGVERADLAVFYAPVKLTTNMSRLSRSRSAEAFLKEYNYAWSNFQLRRLRNRSALATDSFGFTVGIIGSPIPLTTRMAEVEMGEVQVLNLDKDNPYQIGRRVREFRKKLTRTTTGAQSTDTRGGSDLGAKVGSHFYSVGSLEIPTTAEEGHAEPVCL